MHVDFDFAEYRGRCLADESLEAVLEINPGSADLVIYRDEDLEIMKREVPAAALAVLREFRRPATLTEAFERLEGRLSESQQEELEAGIGSWFQAWAADGWLCLADSDSASPA